jgi:hypothetical protein
MQAGEAVDRGRGKLRGVGASAVILGLALWTGRSGAGEAGVPVRMLEHRGLDLSPALIEEMPRGGEARRAYVHTSVSNPYFLDGLAAACTIAGYEGPVWSAGLDWRRLSHALYGEDRCSAGTGVRLPAAGLRLLAGAAVERREVTGLSVSTGYSLAFGAAYEGPRGVSAGFVRAAGGGGVRAARGTAVFAGLAAPAVGIVIEHGAAAARASDTRLLLRVPLDRRCAVALGYRFASGEVASGIVVSLARIMVDLSWSESPALGSTLAAGVGRRWRW